MSDYYEILGVDMSADLTVLRSAYRSLALTCHPDANSDSPHQAHERMVLINLAWETLKDPESRRAYDMTLDRTKRNASHSGEQTGTQQKTQSGPRNEEPRSGSRYGASSSARDNVQMFFVNSRMIDEVGHDGIDKLFVRFKKGDLYVYFGVHMNIFEQLMTAESKGRFLIKNVINYPYRYKRLS